MNCSICPRKCNADRENSVGFCKSPAEFRLARAALHFWEEPCISGENGSGTVFFSGCNLKCVYCQNYEISIENKGIVVDDSRLIEIFKSLIEQGAENINLVNPTHYADRLANLFKKWRCPVPVVYNTSGYESTQTLKMLDGIVDIYLTDFKYIRPDKAQKYSNAPDYPEVAKNALAEMKRQVQGYEFDSRGVMQKGVIVRHLVLPQNTNSALKIIDYIAENYSDTYLSIMAQYVPCGSLENHPEIGRKITEREYNKVVDYALQTGLENVFIQQTESAAEEFIPPFDFTGIL